MRISTIRHPEYADDAYDFLKWRLAYKGGRHFIDRFLTKFSRREDDTAFKERRAISYPPSFAKVAINKLKNTLYSRMNEIVRIGGPKSYQDAIEGKAAGVDLYGCSMDSFIGQEVLEELMVMKRVGVFIDKQALDGNLLANNKDKRPYLYTYGIEDIFTWDYIYAQGEFVFLNVLLRDTNFVADENTGLTMGISERFRHVWLGADEKVHIQFWISNNEKDAEQDIKDGDEIILDLPRIPFVMAGLKESLIADAADYQIGMLNLASSDMNYCFRGNFPFYTEQFDPASESTYIRRTHVPPNTHIDPKTGKDPLTGTQDEGQLAGPNVESKTGALDGRKYPKSLDRPGFIAPPSEPLLASMQKQEQMKADIFELIDIATSQAQPTHASADSKAMDDRGLESGLSYIGLELEYLEREIGKIWAMYENADPPTINYPEKYTLKSDAARIDEAKALNEVKSSAPSRTFAKEVGKRIVRVMLQDKVTVETIEIIEKEIDAAGYISSDPNLIQIASELGMVDAVTGSNALGFDGEKVVPTAQKEHAARLALIAESQAKGAARGNPDAAPIKGANDVAVADKKPPVDTNPTPANDGTRGPANGT